MARTQGASSPSPGPQPSAEPGEDLLRSVIDETWRARTEDQAAIAGDALKGVAGKYADGSFVKTASLKAQIDDRIRAIDAHLSAQLNPILHHPEFQALEASWRGLYSAVQHAGELGPHLQLRMLNASKDDLIEDMPPGSQFDDGTLWKQVYEDEYGTLGGQPYAALIGDYEFSHSPRDLALLKKIAGVAASAHAVFIAAASPELFGWDRFAEDTGRPILEELFESKQYAAWRTFRGTPDARFVGLCLPHVLMRLPYGAKTDPVRGFHYEEDVSGRDSSRYLWGNAAYAFATRLTESFALYHWCTSIRGVQNGGLVTDLPTHNFETDDGVNDTKWPIEISLNDRRWAEYADHGFIPLVQEKSTNSAVFPSAPSCFKPPKRRSDEANANSQLNVPLPYTLAVSRIAHYLKAIARDRQGSYLSAEDCRRELNDWIGQYVTKDDAASPEAKARYPLREAEIDVEEIPGSPGAYRATVRLRPHFQFEKLEASLRLVTQLPNSQNR